MMQAKLTDEITIKLVDGFRARLDRVAAEDKRKPGQWARKVLEEAVEQWEQAEDRKSKLPRNNAVSNGVVAPKTSRHGTATLHL